MKRMSRNWLMMCCAAALWLSGCTIVRYVEPPPENSQTGPPAKIVDMLVLIDLDRSAANLNDSYHLVLGQLRVALTQRNIMLRKAAMAPLYKQVGGAVPLLYGEEPAANPSDGDENVDQPEDIRPFRDFGEAIAYYAFDDGARFLQENASGDGENLAVVGLDLDERSLYLPEQAVQQGRPFFDQPADGFLIVTLSASERRCGYNEGDCQLDGMSAATYFTQGDGAGAAWLELPGPSRLPAENIFHLAVVTPEGKSFAEFEEYCLGLPGFPALKLESMEPSPKPYFKPLTDAINDSGGNAAIMDLCDAISYQGPPLMLDISGKIQSSLR